MSFVRSVVFLACLALAIAQYNPYSPHPPANARDPSLPSRSSSTYNRAQDFRAAGKTPGYPSSFTMPSSQGSYGQQQEQLNGGSGYNGGSQRAPAFNGQQGLASGYGPMAIQGSPSYNGGASSHAAAAYGNGFQYGGQQDGSYDDMAQPSPDDPDGDSIVGVAGSDYPTYAEVPMTSFECSQQQFPGFYADTEAQCQVFHICQDGGHYDSFLCPNGSIFNQQYFVCDWWYNVDCQSAPSFYGLNAELYKDVNSYSSAASYAANLPSDAHSHANGHGPSAGYPAFGQAQASSAYSNGNGRVSARPSSGYGNGNGNGRLNSGAVSALSSDNGRDYSGSANGNGRGRSGPSSAYGNGNGPSRTSSGYGNGNGRGPSGTSSAYGNGRAAAGVASTYANGNGRGRSGPSAAGISTSYANGNGPSRASSGYGNGNGRGPSGTSSAYGNGNGRGSSATSAYGNGNGNGRGSSATSAYGNGNGNGRGGSATSAYGNGNGNGRGGSATSVYGNGNGNGRGGSATSAYGNGNGRGSSATSAYGNGNGRVKAGKSPSYDNDALTSGPRHTSQHDKQLQNDDFSIADMPPLGY